MKRLLASSRTRWRLLAVLWAAGLILGVVGFLQQAQLTGVARTTLDAVYLTLQLIPLNVSGDGTFPWTLQVARFLLPLLAAGTLLQTASLVFADQFHRWRLRFVDGHVVVCGLGDVGTRLAQAFVAEGRTVVGIDLRRDLPGTSVLHAAGVITFAGDASDVEVVRGARVGRASEVICATGDDATNVQIALATAAARRDGTPVRCAVRLANAQLALLLRAADLDASGRVRISFFNVLERAAHAVIAEHPPLAGGVTPDVVVVGLGQFGRNVVLAAAQEAARRDGVERLSVTLVDPQASGRWAALCMQHPALRDACRATLLDVDLAAPTATEIDRLTGLLSNDHDTWVVIAEADESLALSAALFVQRHLVGASCPIIVRTRTASGLGALVGTTTRLGQIVTFPLLDRTCTVETVEETVRERLARAVHEQYARERGGAVKPWGALTDAEREPNRQRVDGLLGDLAHIGRTLAPLRSWGGSAAQFDADEIEALAAREHARWTAQRTADGWTYAPERDDVARHNPLLVPWDQLAPEVQADNRAAAAELPAMLARTGFEAVATDA